MRPGRTGVQLRWLRAGIVVWTLLIAVAFLAVFPGARTTIHTVRDRSGRAVVQVSAARAALAQADRAAIRAFPQAGNVGLGDPGQQYLDEIAVAYQALAQAAEDNEAEEGSSQIQMVEGLLVTYTGLVQQAYGESARSDLRTLGAVHLVNASALLHDDVSGIVYWLDQLDKSETAALDGQSASVRVRPVAVLFWVLPTLVTIALLAWAQILVYRRFRRVLTASLVAAVGCLVAVLCLTGAAVGAERQFAKAQAGTFQSRVDDLAARRLGTDADSQAALIALVTRTCGTGCGDVRREIAGRPAADQGLRMEKRFASVDTLIAAAGSKEQDPAAAARSYTLMDGALTRLTQTDAKAYDDAIQKADPGGYLPSAIPGLAGGALVFTLFGLYYRIQEFRYQP